jgi:NAD(P)-dependent dehydrogenase (short-subunit alcohol dehydrogenase family)
MWNPLDLTGRTILVTGASSGIGRVTSVLLSRLGAQVVLVGRNPDQLRETAERCEGAPCRIEPLDLAAAEDIPGWLKSVAAATGPLHGLVHSAGIQIVSPLRFLKSEALAQTLQINLTVGIQLAKGFRQKNVCAAPSSIVFLASVMGLVGQPGLAAYSASKGALIALARSLALELAAEGIRVNCVAPGCVQTEMVDKLAASLTPQQFDAVKAMHPLGLGDPLDVAHAIAFLLADTGRWITGTTLAVDGGYTAH